MHHHTYLQMILIFLFFFFFQNEIDRVYNASGGAVEPAFKIMAAYTDTHAGKYVPAHLRLSALVQLNQLRSVCDMKVHEK